MDNSKTEILKSLDIRDHMDYDKLYDLTLSKLSHSEADAICELIDNSYDAQAKKVDIYLEKETAIIICDNGFGMNEEQVMASCSFSSKTSEISEIGFFGCGGTASASVLAKKKKILTKTKEGELLVAEQDLVKNVTNVSFSQPSEEDFQFFQKMCGENGTVIYLTDLRKSAKYSRVGDRKNHFLKECGLIFRKLIEGGLIINFHYDKKTTTVKSVDPLFYGDPQKLVSQFTRKHTLEFNGENIQVRMSALNSSLFNDGDPWCPTLEKQGIFFCRGGRQIEHKNHIPDSNNNKKSSGLWSRHNDYNIARVEVDFPAALDNFFNVQMSKNKVILTQDITDKLKSVVVPWLREVKQFIQSNRTKTEVKENNLDEGNEAFNKGLSNNAASCGIPRKITTSGEKLKRKEGNKKGTVQKKGTSITRSSSFSNYDIPNWVMVEDPANRDPYWFDEGAVTMNTATKFMRDLFVEADDKTKNLIRLFIATEYYLMREYLPDSDEENHVSAYMTNFRSKLANLHKQLF